MGLDRSVLVEESIRAMQEPLGALGYTYAPTAPASGYNFWFEKKPKTAGEMYRIIDFQPDGFGKSDLFDLAVNLCRRVYRDYHNSPTSVQVKSGFSVRLAPCLWEKEDGAMDYWWHFTSIEQLRETYQDILEKLLNHGIPFLENPSSTWFTWVGDLAGKGDP